jgi:glycosyltransferase involved in cell wall biosynthesis
VPLLADKLLQAPEGLQRPFEVIPVNDGSMDESEARLQKLGAADRRFRIINFRRNPAPPVAMWSRKVEMRRPFST